MYVSQAASSCAGVRVLRFEWQKEASAHEAWTADGSRRGGRSTLRGPLVLILITRSGSGDDGPERTRRLAVGAHHSAARVSDLAAQCARRRLYDRGARVVRIKHSDTGHDDGAHWQPRVFPFLSPLSMYCMERVSRRVWCGRQSWARRTQALHAGSAEGGFRRSEALICAARAALR